MFRKSTRTLAGIILAVLFLLSNDPASAAISNSALPTGLTRYAVASASTSTTTDSTTFVDLAGLSTSVTIPAGKHADVMVAFCGETRTKSFTQVRAIIGGIVAAPGATQIRENTPTGRAQSQCANFYKLAVPAGPLTIKMQWRGDPAFSGFQQEMFHRTLMVTVNIH